MNEGIICGKTRGMIASEQDEVLFIGYGEGISNEVITSEEDHGILGAGMTIVQDI